MPTLTYEEMRTKYANDKAERARLLARIDGETLEEIGRKAKQAWEIAYVDSMLMTTAKLYRYCTTGEEV